MSMGLIIFLIILFIIAMVGTFMGFKEEEDKMKKHKEEGTTHEDDAKRTEEYENKWLKTGLRSQALIYTVAIVLSVIIALVIYL